MQRVLITGTNRGIGLELARQYAARGEHVFATCRAPDKAAALQQLAAQYPDRVSIIPLEVTDETARARSVQLVREQTRALDILINNAAYNPERRVQAFGTLHSDELLKTMDINAVAPAMIVQEYVGLLKAGTNPRVVNISTDMASLTLRDYGGDYGYSASKTAMNMMTRLLAADLGRHSIIVTALDPGWVKTDMGGKNAALTPQESARGILKVVDHLKREDSGGYFRWNGTTLPW